VDDFVKARVHLIISVAGRAPFSFRTDVLVPVKDPQAAVSQACAQARYALEACSVRTEYHLTDMSVDWGISRG
jgi:hypothetical protein